MADVRVMFEFLGVRKTPTSSGYRPDHEICDGYVTCGMHHYEGTNEAPLCGKIRGTIKFIAPEHYTHTLWEGKELPIREGERLIGYATIEKVLNPLLEASRSNE